MSTILVLEDDRELNQTMAYALEKEGYHVLSAYSCEEAKRVIKAADAASGDSRCESAGWGRVSVLQLAEKQKADAGSLVSARDLEEDVLFGYEMGADDYVTKPFSIKVLLKKIYVILSRKPQGANVYDDGFLKVDFELGTVRRARRNVCSRRQNTAF